jgi:hypothetical protein
VKYAYQESPHSENTASPRSEKEERERERVYIRTLISKGHHKQLTKKRTLGVTAFNSNPHFSPTMLHAKAHKQIKHKKLMALQSKMAGTQ